MSYPESDVHNVDSTYMWVYMHSYNVIVESADYYVPVRVQVCTCRYVSTINCVRTAAGALRHQQLGTVLPALWPLEDRRLQDVEVTQELHHNQGV